MIFFKIIFLFSGKLFHSIKNISNEFILPTNANINGGYDIRNFTENSTIDDINQFYNKKALLTILLNNGINYNLDEEFISPFNIISGGFYKDW